MNQVLNTYIFLFFIIVCIEHMYVLKSRIFREISKPDVNSSYYSANPVILDDFNNIFHNARLP